MSNPSESILLFAFVLKVAFYVRLIKGNLSPHPQFWVILKETRESNQKCQWNANEVIGVVRFEPVLI